jgi:TIR domain
MNDVFISYANEDRQKAAALAQALAERGLSVWWDWEILPGKQFDEAIQQALTAAKCVVVLWSRLSVNKRWVRDEADEGAERGRLVPVLIDEVRIPLGFRRFQAERLMDWDGGDAHPGLARLVEGIRAAITDVQDASGRSRTDSPVSWRRRTFLLLAVPTAAVVVAIWVLHSWRLPTHIQAEVTTGRVEFTVGPTPSSIELLKAVPLQYVAFEKFSSIRFEPVTVERAVPRLPATNASHSAWSRLRLTSRTIRLLPSDPRSFPRITFERPDARSAGTLDALRASSGTRVMLEVGDDPSALGVRLQGEASRAHIAPSQPVQFVAEHLASDEMLPRPDQRAQVFAYRAWLPERSPLVAVEGSDELMIVLSVLQGAATDIFAEGEVPVTEIRFQRFDENGKIVSTLIGEGELRYPAYPQIERRVFRAPSFLGLGELERFSLREIKLDPRQRGVVLRMEGVVGHAMTSAGGFDQDYRLTMLEVLRHSSTFMLTLAAVLWMVPTTIGACRLYRELRR